MKKISLMFVSILLGVVLLGEANARQASGQPEITTGKLVNALRLLNTHEYTRMRMVDLLTETKCSHISAKKGL
jgi:hypothetical protein